MLVPLISLPYLLTILGRETYGLVVFAQTIISYFLILINFGFNLSATKEISIHRDNKKKVSEIVSSIFIIKGFFFFVSFLILWILLLAFKINDENKTLYYLMMYLCLYEWILPIWYFQGLEKMKYITQINLISRIIFLAMLFMLVKEKGDYLKVPLINGIGCTIAGLVGLKIVFINDAVPFKWQSWKILKTYLAESLPLFMGSIAGKIKILSNKAILGAFVGMESVALYDIADKAKDVFLNFLQLIGQVLFPSISKSKNYNITKQSIRIILFAGIVIYFVVGITMSVIIPKFFIMYNEAINLFWILGLLIFIQPVSYLIGTSVMLVNNLKRQYSTILYISTTIYLTLIGIFYAFDMINMYTVSISLLISAITSISSNILVCKKKGLINWVI